MTTSTNNNFKQNLDVRLKTLLTNLAQDFQVSQIAKSPARFNTEKLNWFNREYIKLLSLEEFCYRGAKLQAETKVDEINYRIGDYVYPVDLKTGKILINKSFSPSGQDGQFYPIGGGREGQDPIQSLIREIEEEAGNRLAIDPSKLKFIQTCRVTSDRNWQREGQEFGGKEFNMYFYPVNQNDIEPFDLQEEPLQNYTSTHENWLFDWYDISEVIGTNTHLTYPIWQQFCVVNEIEDTLKNHFKADYQAWVLDKNRATLLSEFGSESDCILSYTKPDLDIVNWKKITTEESLANLKEILEAIKIISAKLKPEKDQLNNCEINDIPINFETLAKLWESELKTWLSENNRDTGPYLWPLRVALSGKAKSPSPFELLAILTIDQVKERVNNLN
jgi:glutamyl/glutaminyl-tRNA synthetase